MSLSKSRNPIYPRFSIEEYEQNSVAVKKVNDAALEYLETLQCFVEKQEQQLKNQKEELVKAQQIDRFTLTQPLYMIVGTIFFGLGVNFATTSPHNWIGWLLCFVGSAIQLVVIFIGIFAKLKR